MSLQPRESELPLQLFAPLPPSRAGNCSGLNKFPVSDVLRFSRLFIQTESKARRSPEALDVNRLLSRAAAMSVYKILNLKIRCFNPSEVLCMLIEPERL